MKKLTTLYTVQQHSLTADVLQTTLRRRFLTSLKDGTRVSETIKVESPEKTWKQVKTIFGHAIARIKQEFDDRGWDTSVLLNTPDPTGQEVSIGLLKEYLYVVCPIFDDEGNRITLSNKKCDREKSAKFIDAVMTFASSRWQIFIPDPDPEWRTKA